MNCPGAASVLRALQYNPSVGTFIRIVQPCPYKYLVETTNRGHALLVRRKICALCGTQQRRSLPVTEIRCRLAKSAVRYSVYRHALYAVVRSVSFFPEAYVISVAVLRLCHAEIGAVGRLYIISHVADGTLYIRRRSERHPAVKRKISLIESRKRHPSKICPMRIALSCACMLRPRTVAQLTVWIVTVSELTAVVPELEKGIHTAAALVELQLRVLELLLKVLLCRVHFHRELYGLLAALQLERRLIGIRICACEGDQYRPSLVVLHA